jgi:3D (Asp-Asp-Asp) domain-containing protein
MRKGDNGMKIFGVIVILVFFGSLFGSVASAGNLGEFYATAYHCVYESEMSGTQTVTKTISGTPYTLKASFLFGGYGVAMQGTGRTGPAGDYIHYTGGGGGFVSVDDPVNDAAVRQRYAQIGITDFTGFGKKGLNYPSDATYSKVSEITGASGRTLISWYSIAVDPSELSLGTTGTVLFKSGTTPEGATQMSFRADDTGGGITGKHVDIYVAEGQSAIDEWYQTGGNRNVEVHTGDKFNIGDTVRVTNNLNVRTEPGTGYPEITDPDYPGYAPAGAIGIVLSGPSSANSYIWWEVDYGPGSYSGWSVEGGLEKVDDNTPPTVDAFSVTLDDTFTIPYTVSDTGGSGLKQVELWRKGTGSWEQIEVTSLVCEGDGPYSNSFSDAPPSVGTYLYGIHVQDIAGNEGLEPNPPGPIEVEVTPSDVTPPPPPILSSSTHPNENNWYNNNDPLFTWTTPSDASGIAGYRYTIDHFSSTTPDTSVDITGNSKFYTNLADGT